MSRLNWDDAMMVTGLQKRTDLNHHAARVLADRPREDGRIPIEMFIGQERIWIKSDNLLGPIHSERALSHPRYKDMPDVVAVVVAVVGASHASPVVVVVVVVVVILVAM